MKLKRYFVMSAAYGTIALTAFAASFLWLQHDTRPALAPYALDEQQTTHKDYLARLDSVRPQKQGDDTILKHLTVADHALAFASAAPREYRNDYYEIAKAEITGVEERIANLKERDQEFRQQLKATKRAIAHAESAKSKTMRLAIDHTTLAEHVQNLDSARTKLEEAIINKHEYATAIVPILAKSKTLAQLAKRGFESVAAQTKAKRAKSFTRNAETLAEQATDFETLPDRARNAFALFSANHHGCEIQLLRAKTRDGLRGTAEFKILNCDRFNGQTSVYPQLRLKVLANFRNGVWLWQRQAKLRKSG